MQSSLNLAILWSCSVASLLHHSGSLRLFSNLWALHVDTGFRNVPATVPVQRGQLVRGRCTELGVRTAVALPSFRIHRCPNPDAITEDASRERTRNGIGANQHRQKKGRI
ncbi:uncharacterized protein EV420DRAFT_1548315 [Desarmillaria tabescens]|uniref:Secreted protein n=1 Tax=Armillaria tabescens TaxID=1929756 RepID=A0AA39KAE1_ARMTA|nr:uncharacterized protein EV420DRAFT_1548315 [Desarmillaria tabescens]KAK0457450.1 hypothetical protein EV420DRAFT_1548315 [Desarmillaria tabescens]